jgi:transposase InsO family protein
MPNVRTIKKELVHGEDYASREEARASIFEYIEVFYNRVRRHSSLDYRSPDEYERAG